MQVSTVLYNGSNFGSDWNGSVTMSSYIAEKQTYIGAMVQKIVDNLQIEIKGIHVRYEDDTNTPEVCRKDPIDTDYCIPCECMTSMTLI
jgi:hypothetical protein